MARPAVAGVLRYQLDTVAVPTVSILEHFYRESAPWRNRF